MTPSLGTRPVSSVGLATNWRLSTTDNQTHPDWSFDRQRFLYGRLSICFSSCIFHSCIFHSRIFSAPIQCMIFFCTRSNYDGGFRYSMPLVSSRLIELCHLTDTKWVISETFLANSWLNTEELNLTQQTKRASVTKHTITQNKNKKN